MVKFHENVVDAVGLPGLSQSLKNMQLDYSAEQLLPVLLSATPMEQDSISIVSYCYMALPEDEPYLKRVIEADERNKKS
jgi:hypothetical protein